MPRLRFATVLLLAATGAVPAGDWPQFLGPTRDGASPETGLVRTFPKGGLKVLWKKDVGAGWSAPVVTGDRLIIHHRVEHEEVVECLDPATGEQRWKKAYRTRYRDDFGFDEGPRSTPVIGGGRVLTLGPDGELTGWDLKDGRQLWQRNVNADYKVRKSFFGVGTSPMLVGEKLLVNVGGKGAGVVAFDPATGNELWKAADDAVSYSSPVLARIGGEELAVFFTREGLLALTPDKGEVRYSHPWRPRNPNSVNAASPVVAGDQILLTTSYNTGAVLLEAGNGKLKELWSSDESLSAHYNTPVHHDGHLYGIDGRQEYVARLRCVEWKTGEVRWTAEKFGCACILKADGIALAVTEAGELVLFELSPERYRELARAAVLEKPVRAAAALANGRLYARDGAKLICVDLKK